MRKNPRYSLYRLARYYIINILLRRIFYFDLTMVSSVTPTQNFAVKRGQSAQPDKREDHRDNKEQQCYCISGNNMLRPWSTQDLAPLNTIMAWGPNDDF